VRVGWLLGTSTPTSPIRGRSLVPRSVAVLFDAIFGAKHIGTGFMQ
jgi:hypothetical protein